ncbi:hypothetical protein [Paenibacillus oryzisoli]|nr:hypothetical protein [Paenibacillus oryzisoli]
MLDKEKLIKAKKWFENATEADSSLIGFMGLTESMLVEMYEREVEGKVTQ